LRRCHRRPRPGTHRTDASKGAVLMCRTSGGTRRRSLVRQTSSGRERCLLRGRDVDAGKVDGDSEGTVVCIGAKLMGPKDIARSVILPDVSVASTRVDLSREGPASVAGHVDARRVRNHTCGVVEPLGAELVGPRYVRGEVVFANET